MRQLARPVHVSIERLLPCVLAIAAMCLEQVLSTIGQGDRAVPAVQRDEPDEAFVAEVAQVRLADVRRLVPWVLQVAFGDDAKRADRRERPTVVAVQFVPMLAVEHHFSVEAARELQALDERVARVAIARVDGAVAHIRLTVTRVVLRRSAPERDPMHVDLASVVVSCARIDVEHRFTSGGPATCRDSDRTDYRNW